MLTIMSAAPFNGQKDIDQGIAYISVVFVFFLVISCYLLPQGMLHATHAGFILDYPLPSGW